MLNIERNLEPVPERIIIVQRNEPGISFYKKPKKLWGGCMPYVSVDCERIDFCFLDDGVRWIDLSLCHSCSIQAKCQQRHNYLKALAYERKISAKNKSKTKIEQEED